MILPLTCMHTRPAREREKGRNDDRFIKTSLYRKKTKNCRPVISQLPLSLTRTHTQAYTHAHRQSFLAFTCWGGEKRGK